MIKGQGLTDVLGSLFWKILYSLMTPLGLTGGPQDRLMYRACTAVIIGGSKPVGSAEWKTRK